MLPPSATDGVALRLTVVALIVSLIVVVAAAGFATSDSKLPPVAVLIVTDTLPALTYTSSLGADTLTVPLEAPAAMVIVAPFDSVTVSAVSGACVIDAV